MDTTYPIALMESAAGLGREAWTAKGRHRGGEYRGCAGPPRGRKSRGHRSVGRRGALRSLGDNMGEQRACTLVVRPSAATWVTGYSHGTR